MNEVKQMSPSPLPSPNANSASDDRISALDDDLCMFILRLAHLNVRELVRTSALSKRWRGLWKRLPILDFFGWPEFQSAGEVQQYIAIVNDVLEQRAGATSEAHIDEVKIPLLLDVYSINGLQWLRLWRRTFQQSHPITAAARATAEQLLMPTMEAAKARIRYAMHHQVKGFHFYLRPLPLENKMPVMDLDELLPSSPKLECMRLGLSNTEVRLPRTAVFTSLKDLTLEYVELAAGGGHLLARLLSSVCCPNLQKLRMMHVNLLYHTGAKELVLDTSMHVNLCCAGTKELVLDNGELLELSMEAIKGMELLELRTPKLLYLEIDECYHESLRVSVPRLEDLTYVSNRAFIHSPLPRVWRLKIDLLTHKEEDDDRDANSSSICLLKRCSSSVRCLLVHPLLVPSGDEWQVDLIKDKIPQLPNVTSLLVSIAATCERHSFGDGVAGLLTRFKNLEYLSLLLDTSDTYPKMDEYYSEDGVDSAFTCNHPYHWESSNISLANLRKADFQGMTGTGCEVRFLRFVLANATDLQSVTVSFNLYFIEELQDSWMHYFLHALLGDGTWTTCENKDQDFEKLYNYKYTSKFSKLYKWTPSP